jgi:hypothetical protein
MRFFESARKTSGELQPVRHPKLWQLQCVTFLVPVTKASFYLPRQVESTLSLDLATEMLGALS